MNVSVRFPFKVFKRKRVSWRVDRKKEEMDRKGGKQWKQRETERETQIKKKGEREESECLQH